MGGGRPSRRGLGAGSTLLALANRPPPWPSPYKGGRDGSANPSPAVPLPAPMPPICVIGDVHGHLQLALCVAARWQRELGTPFDAVLLCGDVGSFTHDSQLDNATRRHGRENPCEFEFLTQWSTDPPAPWLRHIFTPVDEGGLGLTCPVAFVHGNHEGFAHLAPLARRAPANPVPVRELPAADSGGHLRYLPSGWRVTTDAGKVVGGVGGIEAGQRRARYHDLAYLDEDAILRLLVAPPFDLLITHQGPGGVQGDHGSPSLQPLLDAGVAAVWCHGHSAPVPGPVEFGRTTVVPLRDAAFPKSLARRDHFGEDAFALVDGPTVTRGRPAFWRDYRFKRWHDAGGGRLVCPDLWPWARGRVSVF